MCPRFILTVHNVASNNPYTIIKDNHIFIGVTVGIIIITGNEIMNIDYFNAF